MSIQKLKDQIQDMGAANTIIFLNPKVLQANCDAYPMDGGVHLITHSLSEPN